MVLKGKVSSKKIVTGKIHPSRWIGLISYLNWNSNSVPIWKSSFSKQTRNTKIRKSLKIERRRILKKNLRLKNLIQTRGKQLRTQPKTLFKVLFVPRNRGLPVYIYQHEALPNAKSLLFGTWKPGDQFCLNVEIPINLRVLSKVHLIVHSIINLGISQFMFWPITVLKRDACNQRIEFEIRIRKCYSFNPNLKPSFDSPNFHYGSKIPTFKIQDWKFWDILKRSQSWNSEIGFLDAFMSRNCCNFVSVLASFIRSLTFRKHKLRIHKLHLHVYYHTLTMSLFMFIYLSKSEMNFVYYVKLFSEPWRSILCHRWFRKQSRGTQN